MPAVRNSNDAKETGRKAVRAFIGTMTEFQEDVEGTYGLQVRITYRDVVVTESDDGFQPDEGIFTEYVKQSSNKSSVYIKKLAAVEEFLAAHGILGGDPWDSLQDKRMEYKQVELVPGNEEKKFSPGVSFVPVRIVPDDEVAGEPAEEESGDYEPAEALVTAVLEFLESNGASTPAVMERTMKTKSPTRKALADSGGMQRALDYMVDAEMLDMDEGVYSIRS